MSQRRLTADELEKYSVFMNYENSNNIPVNDLAKKWDVTPQKIVSMISVAKRSTMIFKELVNKGYVADEVPPWIVSNETAALTVRRQSSEVVEDAEQTPASLLVAPKVQKSPSLGQGSPGDGSALRDDQQRTLTLSATASVDDATQRRLRDANIVQIDDGRWMHVEPMSDGGYTMTPVDIGLFLRGGGGDARGEMPGMPEISEMMMDELKIKTNAIMKKVALNPSVYWGHTYVTTQKDPDTGEPLFIGDLGDWLNWCNEFTLDKGYGVVPAMIVGRPSFYTYLRQQRIATPQQGNIIPLNQRRADNE